METDTPETSDEPLASLRHYASLPEASEHALVVLAMNEACWVLPAPDGYRLCVHPAGSDTIAAELAAYDSERSRPRPEIEVPWVDASLAPSVLWAVLALAVFCLQLEIPMIVDLGANSTAGLFLRGEWWRPFTSLFLHADFHHLLGNLVGGLTFFTLTARSFGTLRGWGLALLSGVLGNLLTAWFHHPEPFRSVGASTAVFGALGLLTGLGIRFAWFGHRSLRPLVAPVGGGLMLLAWLGAGGPDVDILGHLFGFGAGLVLGFLANGPGSARQTPPNPPAPAQERRPNEFLAPKRP